MHNLEEAESALGMPMTQLDFSTGPARTAPNLAAMKALLWLGFRADVSSFPAAAAAAAA